MAEGGTAPAPLSSTRPRRADEVARGPTYAPENLVKLLTPDQWEELVEDWASTLRTADGITYHTVHRIGSAGDEGRDVIAFLGDPATNPEWDNYQCKRYTDPLRPSDVWVELGKLCYYTHKQSYKPPRRYRFVSTKDVTNDLYKLLSNAEKLRAGLIDAWGKSCEKGITSKERVVLEGDLLRWVSAYDFSTVGHMPVKRLLEQFRASPAFSKYFPSSLPHRPVADKPPVEAAQTELRYVRQLLNAYGHCQGCEFRTDADLTPGGVHRRHYDRSRVHFYEAESLRVFSRSAVEPGTFEALQDEVLDGVQDVHDGTHRDGFERVKAVVQAARSLQIDSNALRTVLTVADRAGICHQLANADKLTWVEGK